MTVVTGATGQLGSRVVDRLLERLPADRIGVSVRDPEAPAAVALAGRGVRVRRGDFTRPETLARAFEGARQLLLVSSTTTGEAVVAQHRAAIDAARAAGVERVVYTSHQGSSATSRFAPMPDHAATEQYLASSGLAHTSLRNGFYATTLPALVDSALRTGTLALPEDGPVSWTGHDDLAEAAVAVLLGQVRHEGPTPALTGPAALDLDAVAAQLSELAGRTVQRVTVSDDAYLASMAEHGAPKWRARLMLGLFQAARDGEFAVVAPDLAEIIGHPATPVGPLLRQTVHAAGAA
ncbi:NmrA family NAD(P)-binding protein [Streptomyces similanensis]